MGNIQFREILIFVAGITPQIVTETIYALSWKEPPIHPYELYIINNGYRKTTYQKYTHQYKCLRRPSQ